MVAYDAGSGQTGEADETPDEEGDEPVDPDVPQAEESEDTGEAPSASPVPETYLFTGAATHRIPIEVPPGRAGMGPNLALVYNSYGANGWVGVGWSLDIGSIQRAVKHGLDYSSNDYVAMVNGSVAELVPSSQWGSNCYRSKIEGAFSKYRYNPYTGGWEVTLRDGKTYYYGSDSNSRQENGAGQPFKWRLDRVEDTNGNYMTVTYNRDQGRLYLKTIGYAGNSGEMPTYYVTFHTDARPDVETHYQSHAAVTTAGRLSSIEVWYTPDPYNDDVWRHIRKYDIDLRNELLQGQRPQPADPCGPIRGRGI